MEPDARHKGGRRAPWLLREEGASHGFGAIDAFEPDLVNKNIPQMDTSTCAVNTHSSRLPRGWSHPHFRCTPLRGSQETATCWCLYEFSAWMSLWNLNPHASFKGIQIHQWFYTPHMLMGLYDSEVSGLLASWVLPVCFTYFSQLWFPSL